MYCGLKNVYKTYGSNTVMENFSCEIKKNKITVFFGNSGCGKTTLTRLLLSLEKPDSGEIVMPNVKKSVLFQEDRLLEWLTVSENLSCVLDRDDSGLKEKVNTVLERVELLEYKDSYPNELSGGMKRRLSLARALIYDGDIVILDEPFKGFDSQLKERILPYISQLKDSGKTVIMITHDINEANALADEIYFMKGTPLEVVSVEYR